MGIGHYLFGFSGRINRAKIWLFLLLYVIFICVAVAAILSTIGMQNLILIGQHKLAPETIAHNPALGPLCGIIGLVYLVFVWIALAVVTKRLHDRNKSAWWLLVFVGVPVVLGMVRFAIVIGQMQQGGPMAVTGNPVATLLFGVSAVIQIWAFVELYCLRGTVGDNTYGPDPLGG